MIVSLFLFTTIHGDGKGLDDRLLDNVHKENLEFLEKKLFRGSVSAKGKADLKKEYEKDKGFQQAVTAVRYGTSGAEERDAMENFVGNFLEEYASDELLKKLNTGSDLGDAVVSGLVRDFIHETKKELFPSMKAGFNKMRDATKAKLKGGKAEKTANRLKNIFSKTKINL